MKKIIYPENTGIAIIHPTGEKSIQDTANQIVPTGVVYKIIDSADIPQDRDFREAWEFDFTTDFDGVGA